MNLTPHYSDRARRIAAAITDTACGGLGEWWSSREGLLRRANTATEIADAIRPALDLCHHCPAWEACADLAEADRYSGIAAGGVFTRGRRRKLSPAADRQRGAA